MLKVGDYVTRKKYGNDIVFKVTKIEKENVYLKGIEIRLFADAKKEDLVICEECKKKQNREKLRIFDKDKYFYIPGVILHLDTDEDYLNRCLEYYKSQEVKSYGYVFEPREFKNKINTLIIKHKPNIIVITGHDAYYEKKNTYKNSKYFIETVEEIRKNYKKHSDMIIVSGACQSDYEGLIKAKSTFASSPNHINVHALDPAIIASYMAILDKVKIADIEEVLSKTEYGSAGFGGIITYGTLICGYPRKDKN